MAGFDSDTRSFGWVKNRPNARRPRFAAHPASSVPAAALPPSAFLVTPPSLDQGPLGSCTANAAAMAVAILTRGAVWLSRLMVYFGARKRLGAQYVSKDSGAMPDDALETIRAGEAGPESLAPYDVTRFRESPPAAALVEAKRHSVYYHDFDESPDVVLAAKQALAAGSPVNLGFTLRQHPSGGMEIDHLSAAGVIPWNPGHALTRSGHDVLLVGYDDAIRAFLAVNSWGQSWGVGIPGQDARGKGCFWIPYTMWQSTDVDDRAAVMNWS